MVLVLTMFTLMWLVFQQVQVEAEVPLGLIEL